MSALRTALRLAPAAAVLTAFACAPLPSAASGPIPADACPGKTPRGRWTRIPPMPGPAPRPGPPTWRPTAPRRTVFALGRLYVFTGKEGGWAFDPCRGSWARFPTSEVPVPPATGPPDPDPALDPQGALASVAFGHLRVAIIHFAGTRGHPLQVLAGAVVRIRGRQIRLPPHGAPAPRAPGSYVLVAAGHRLIVWGGRTAAGLTRTGEVLDLRSRRWRPMTTRGAPSPRARVRIALWTGRRLVVYGGWNGMTPLDDGATYDPVHDRWRKMPAAGAPAKVQGIAVTAFDGHHLIFLPARPGGAGDPGGIYDPSANRWIPVAPHAGLWPVQRPRMFRDGTRRLVVVSARGDRIDLLDVATGAWSPIDLAQVHLAGRVNLSIHWTGARLVVFGGAKRKVISPGGGCGGVRPRGMGCDPMPPEYADTPQRDGAIYRPPHP